MALGPDILFDRRRLKREVGVWRLVAIGVGLLAVLALFGRLPAAFERSHIVRLSVEGLIVEDRERDRALLAAAEDPKVAAILVAINSPGGTVVGGEDLYRTLLKVGEKKPVVASLGTMATSAAYMTAIAAERIFAREGSITGSIGVILQTTEFTGLMAKLGIVAESIKSSPLKAQPSPLEPLTEEGRAATRAMVMDSYAMFVGMVAERRKFDAATATQLADGRIFTGRQAIDTKLIDEIGDERAAQAWLESARGVARGLPLKPLEVRREVDPFSRLVGQVFGKTFLSEGLTLDGLVSVWHPDLTFALPH
ncbi:MAG: signal peptide peptidase SppA [Alphaproteobacteria bacterium]|nr:signal peptide peptidase SppA [Alphaproteobacteria bacterium]